MDRGRKSTEYGREETWKFRKRRLETNDMEEAAETKATEAAETCALQRLCCVTDNAPIPAAFCGVLVLVFGFVELIIEAGREDFLKRLRMVARVSSVGGLSGRFP